MLVLYKTATKLFTFCKSVNNSHSYGFLKLSLLVIIDGIIKKIDFGKLIIKLINYIEMFIINGFNLYIVYFNNR